LQKPQGIIWPQCSGEQPARQRGLAYGLRERMMVGGAAASVVVASKALQRFPASVGGVTHASSGGRCRGSFVPVTLTRGRGSGPWRSRPCRHPPVEIVGATGGISSARRTARYTADNAGGRGRPAGAAPRSLFVTGCSSPCAVKRTAPEVGVRFGDHRRLRGTLRTKTTFRRRGGTQGIGAVLGDASRRLGNVVESLGARLTTSWLQRLATGIFCGLRRIPRVERPNGEAVRRQ
jgi:hypothetical protein